MRWPLNFRFKGVKRDPKERAAEIKAKYEAKQVPPELFTKAQAELMDELGLTPGQVKPEKSKKTKEKNTKARDPLTARQRKLAEELGLIKRK
jgi:hypothetical protein